MTACSNVRALSLVLIATCSLVACSRTPDAIPATYTSSVPCEAWSCTQIVSEQAQVATALSAVSAQQAKTAQDDAIGVLVLGLPVGGKDQSTEVGRLKGMQEALQRASAHNQCGGVTGR